MHLFGAFVVRSLKVAPEVKPTFFVDDCKLRAHIQQTAQLNMVLNETLVFDQEANTVKRSTATPAGPGGTSAVEVPACAKDALAFLYFLRQSLAMGRIPPPDDLYFGAGYLVSLTFAETLSLSTARGNLESEKILVDISGPKSQHSFEIFFAKDAARTPLLVRVPFDVGTFSLKLLE